MASSPLAQHNKKYDQRFDLTWKHSLDEEYGELYGKVHYMQSDRH